MPGVHPRRLNPTLGLRSGRDHSILRFMAMSVRFELFVTDRSATIAFYTIVLPFHVIEDGQQYTRLKCGNVNIGIGQISDLPAVTDGDGFSQNKLAANRGAGVEIVLETSELAEIHERIIEAGWPLAAPLQERPWGLRDFRIVDPDGYYLRLTEETH